MHPYDFSLRYDIVPAVYHQDIRLVLFYTAGQLGQYSKLMPRQLLPWVLMLSGHRMNGGKYGESDRVGFR